MHIWKIFYRQNCRWRRLHHTINGILTYIYSLFCNRGTPITKFDASLIAFKILYRKIQRQNLILHNLNSNWCLSMLAFQNLFVYFSNQVNSWMMQAFLYRSQHTCVVSWPSLAFSFTGQFRIILAFVDSALNLHQNRAYQHQRKAYSCACTQTSQA